MDIFKKLFENSKFDLSDINQIVDSSEKVVQTALAMSQEDGAKAVVVLCLALAKTCVDAKIPVELMVESVLEMEEAYLDAENVGSISSVLDN